MINHVRTLLSNRSYSDRKDPDFPGEIFTPEEARQRMLFDVVRNVWWAFFGDPDRLALNYRLAEAVAVLHGSDLAPDVTLADPRLTYDGGSGAVFPPTTFGVEVSHPADGVECFIGGTFSQDSRGACTANWKLDLTPTQVVVERRTAPKAKATVEFAFSASLSQPIPLIGSDLAFRCRQPGGPQTFRVAASARPTVPLGERFVDAQRFLAGNEARFFSTPHGAKWFEVYRDTRGVTVNRLAAVLLTLAENIESSPTSGE